MQSRSFIILYTFPAPDVEEAWRECLEHGDLPTHFAAPEFFHEPNWSGEPRFAILALDPGSPRIRIVAVMTGRLRGKSIISGQLGTPQICVDKSFDRDSACRGLVEGLAFVAKSADTVTVYSWFPIEPLRNAKFQIKETSGSAYLDISGGDVATFNKLKGRSQIRHAISAGVAVRVATDKDLCDYHAILKAWSDAKRLPCLSLEQTRSMFQLTTNRRLFVAVHEGTVIAGTPIRFYRNHTAEYAWNASLPEAQKLRSV